MKKPVKKMMKKDMPKVLAAKIAKSTRDDSAKAEMNAARKSMKKQRSALK